ncbi:TPA: Kiwa anti-phage protein KwaB-like domain-containing protein, partial [Listeria monocytogenes]
EIEKLRKKCNGKVALFLIRYKAGAPLFYKPHIQQEVQEELLDIFLDEFKNTAKRNVNQEEYDFVINNNDINYITNKDKFVETNNFFSKLEDENNHIKELKKLAINQVFAYSVRVKLETDNYLYFFGSFKNLAKIKKGKVIGNLKKNELVSLESNSVLGLDGNIKLLFWENDILIRQTRFFEKLCDLSKLYKNESQKVLKVISEYAVIENMTRLTELANENILIARRLTKLNSDPERVKNFFKNVENVEKVLQDEKFNDKFTGITYVDKKLNYDENEPNKFITLIADAAYESIVGKEKRIDKGL